MPLPAPNLDDLRFQKDLVDEARRRIIHYCPEWTDYNLSDPGITLIELFAWMTEMIVYRLNRVPEKNYIKFMELLGMQLQPAGSARAELTFRLSTPFPISPEDNTLAIVPPGTEVATRQTEEEEEVTFTTDERLIIRPPVLTELRRAGEFHKNYLPRLGIEIFYAFNEQAPRMGDTFYIGFREDEDISGHILQLTFECERTQAVGIKREDPPWVWECSIGNDRWQEIQPSARLNEKDTTGGLNNPQGRLILYLPLAMRPDQVNGRSAYWIRCRLEQRRPEQGMYTESPRVVGLTAHSLGATTRATHAVIVQNEMLGRSNGDPGQIFRLQNSPILALRPDETVQVEEYRDGELVFVPWQRVPDFSGSDRFDRHFTLDTATGEVRFGPAIRQSDGTVRQYGRIPQAGHAIRYSRYRYGGGVAGNVPADKIQVLKSAIPYIDQVSNMQRAAGGRDQENLEELKMRAQRELRAQLRAVTPEDYEDLALKASRSVARVKCNVPQKSSGRLAPGVVEILIVPAVADSLRAGDLSKLDIDEPLAQTVSNHLDSYRLLTTTLHIKTPNYLGIKVEAEIVCSEFSQPDLVRARVVDTLRNFINPLPVFDDPARRDELMDTNWKGWPFGRNLYVAEIFSLIQRVAGVKHVLDVKLHRRQVIPASETPLEAEDAAETRQPRLQEVKQKVVRVPVDTLLCSLAHEITLVELGEEDD